MQVARDALFDLAQAALNLGAGEIVVAVIHCLELGAIDGDAGVRQQTCATAQFNEPRANPSDRQPGLWLGTTVRSVCIVCDAAEWQGNQCSRRRHLADG